MSFIDVLIPILLGISMIVLSKNSKIKSTQNKIKMMGIAVIGVGVLYFIIILFKLLNA